MTMANNLIPFPARRATGSGRRKAEEHCQVIFQIGGSRYAFEFSSSVIELNTACAPLIPIHQPEQKQNRPVARLGPVRERNLR